jgi:acyl-CoA synthetase (AMP-forming)/AMP-acid ligase II
LRTGVSLTDDELGEFCAERLADYKRPRRITFVGELPRNATGKVMKHVLKAETSPTVLPAG